MEPLEKMEIPLPESRYLFEFSTLDKGQLARKPNAQRDWYGKQGLPMVARETSWVRDRLKAIFLDFEHDGRAPRWVPLHPDLPPALVGDLDTDMQIVVQVRASFEFEPFLPSIPALEVGCV